MRDDDPAALDEIDKYSMYSEVIRGISARKAELNEAVVELAKVNTAYQKYLERNPYKEKKKILTKKVDSLREELMKAIPDKFGVIS